MSTPLRIPRLAVSMTEGTLLEWLVADGAVVEEGTPLYILETDKVESEVAAPVGGTLRIGVPAGGVHAVGDVVGDIVP